MSPWQGDKKFFNVTIAVLQGDKRYLLQETFTPSSFPSVIRVRPLQLLHIRGKISQQADAQQLCPQVSCSLSKCWCQYAQWVEGEEGVMPTLS